MSAKAIVKQNGKAISVNALFEWMWNNSCCMGCIANTYYASEIAKQIFNEKKISKKKQAAKKINK